MNLFTVTSIQHLKPPNFHVNSTLKTKLIIGKMLAQY